MKKKLIAFVLSVCMLVPIFGGNVFAASNVTWDAATMVDSITLSNGNLTAGGGGPADSRVIATEGRSTGKWYWEITFDSGYIGSPFFSVADSSNSYNSLKGYRAPNGGLINVALYPNHHTGQTGMEIPVGGTLGLALDVDNGTLKSYVNGTLLSPYFEDIHLVGDTIYPAMAKTSNPGYDFSTTANFGATPFKYSIPEDYKAYNEGTAPSNNSLSVLLEVDEQVTLAVSDDLSDNQDFTWTSTNAAVAQVDVNGKVTALKEGQAEIWAKNADGSFEEYIPVKVVGKGKAVELRVAVKLQPGQYARLYVSDSKNIIWKSVDTSIATVSSTGKVTAVSPGLAIITAEVDGATHTIYVRVQ